ncbi:MAG: LysR substrate-binding domain-containing protein [Actinomycetota bacterium]|nr:LysR substrate-binding domain-containing protein [Actinomycetota bacterium]
MKWPENRQKVKVTREERMDPRRLLIFREVARRGSLSAAAAALGWTQPAVGQHVHRLERDLGLALALRSTRGITLTDAGTALLVHADAVAARLSAADEDMLSLAELRGGRLRLVAFPSACALLIPSALVSLAHHAPDLDVRLTELEPPEALALVLTGDADLAVTFQYRTADRDEHRDLVAVPLLDEPILLVLPTTHPLADRSSRTGIEFSELAGEQWIAGCARCRTHLLSEATAAGFLPDIRHSTDDYVVAQNLVAAGLGITLLPQLALTAAPNQGVRAIALASNPIRQIQAIARRELATLPSVRAALVALQASAAEPR